MTRVPIFRVSESVLGRGHFSHVGDAGLEYLVLAIEGLSEKVCHAGEHLRLIG